MENECFLKMDQSDSKVNLNQWALTSYIQNDRKVTHECAKWSQNDPKDGPARSVVRFLNLVVDTLTLQNLPEKCVFPVYGPVWAGYKATWYALHVPFDVYMPLLGSIFHFRAIVFHYFYENCSQSDPNMTP